MNARTQAYYIERDDPRFPLQLKDIKPPIAGLWCRGRWRAQLWDKTVAIVGSRKMSRYGKQVLSEIVPKLVDSGYTTISGFMYGIDVEMHRLTMESEGDTVGVFGWGIDYPVIPETADLYHKLIDRDSLFMSEMEPKEAGTLWSFPKRNRIVVGLADIVIVVEAGLKSGSLNSAEWAHKLNKQVYAVPGSIFSPVSSGCNWLIEQGLAKPFTMEFFSDKSYSKKGRNNQAKVVMSESESSLVTHLTISGPASVNEIARSMGISAGEVSSMLMSLFLRGIVAEERGVWGVL